MRKAAIPVLLAFALAAPAFAVEEKAKPAEGKAGEKAGETKKGGKPGTNVDMPSLMAPLTDADGKLMGYAYISTAPHRHVRHLSPWRCATSCPSSRMRSCATSMPSPSPRPMIRKKWTFRGWKNACWPTPPR